LTDLGVVPKPGGEGEQAKPDSASRAPGAMIVTMAYDEDLVSRIRELDRVRERLHGAEDVRRLEPWALQSVAFARPLPPKEKK
jgi:hypothetical protein